MVLDEKKLIEHILGVLNRALKADPDAITKLVNQRVACNKVLGKDPTIQCGASPHNVGILGIINGIAGIDVNGWGPIAAVIKDQGEGQVEEFIKTPRYIDKEI